MAAGTIEDENRILRFWTPILLRTILVAAATILVFGLILMTSRPDFYVTRYRAAQAQHFVARRTFAQQLTFATHSRSRRMAIRMRS
jgi:hypothetical protein